VDGRKKSQFQDFKHYTDAKRAGDKKAAELASDNGSQLSPGQTQDMLDALEVLRNNWPIGEKLPSVRFVVGAYCEAVKKLKGRSVSEAIDGFLSTVAMVQRVDLKQAVDKFIEGRKLLTVAKDGKRPQLSPGWHYIVQKWLEEFANTFPGHAVTDITKEHLAKYLEGHNDVSPRTRNGRRNAIKMFLKWCADRDYLIANHRLAAADGMAKEVEDFGEIESYTAKELRDMLDGTTQAEYRSLRPVIALNGLAGLRLQEVVRLTWQDVFRIRGHIEVTAGKAKTRQRRLVPICSALAAWLQEYRNKEGNVWDGTLDSFHDLLGKLRESVGVAAKRNGFRHGFCAYHFALHSNENLTAQIAGNSPAMIHAHYKSLSTKKEARAWFAVRPAKAAHGEKVIQLKTARK